MKGSHADDADFSADTRGSKTSILSLNPRSSALKSASSACSVLSQPERVEVVHELVQVVLRAALLAGLPLRDADRQADRLPAVVDQLPVPLLHGHAQGVGHV